MELVSFGDLKSLLDLEKDDISEYPALEVIQESVVTGFESFLSTRFEEEERESTFWPTSPTSFFVVDVTPLVSISTVTVEGVETTDYRRTQNGIKLNTPTIESVVISYTGGYSDDTLPTEITRAALYQTSFEYQQKDIIGASSVQTSNGTTKKPGFKLLDEVKEMLSPYKHPLVVS